MFDVEFEKDVLATALRDMAFCRQATPVFGGHAFSSKVMAWIWDELKRNVDDHRELPTAKLWSVAIRKEWEQSKQPHATAVLLELLKRQVAAPRSALEQIRQFVQLTSLRKAADDGLSMLESGDLDGAASAFHVGVVDARAAQSLQPPGKGSDWEERYNSYLPEEAVFRFPPNLPYLTRVLNGGLPPGALGLIIAQTNIGKSTFMADLGHAALQVENVVVAHITTEETRKEAFARYDARFTGIERSVLLTGLKTQNERDLFRSRMIRAGSFLARLRVHEMPMGSNCSGISSFLEEVRSEFPTEPILLLLDSPDHMQPPNAARTKDHRLQVSAVYEYAKAVVNDPAFYPAACWCVSWAKAASEGKKMTANSASETADKGRIVSAMLGLSDGEDTGDESEKEEVVDLLKNRLGRVKGGRIVVSVNHGTCEHKELDVAEQKT